MITTVLPIKTANPLNGSHRHWSVKAKERKIHRRAACLATLLSAGLYYLNESLGAYVTITRLAPSNGLDPHDGLGAALKGVIDGVADGLGLHNDRDPRVKWKLRQERSKTYGVRIQFRKR